MEPINQNLPANPAVPHWHKYRKDSEDSAGHMIASVHALEKNYVIYFSSESEVYYETTDELLKGLGNADMVACRIKRLLPSTRTKWGFRQNLATLKHVGSAYEMIFCGHNAEGLTILNDIREKLETTAETARRLYYQVGSILVTIAAWIAYVKVHDSETIPEEWQPWILAAALAMAGGIFSVCLNLGSLKVSINQPRLFLLFAGATRSVVALLAGIALLLAMRSKMVAALVYPDGTVPDATDLVMPEMFFCFLAGFSESFVPNILRDSESGPAGAKSKPAEETETEDEQAVRERKAAEVKKAEEAAARAAEKANAAERARAAEEAQADEETAAAAEATARVDAPTAARERPAENQGG